MKLLKGYLKWICNKNVAVITGVFLFFVIPFTILISMGSMWAIVWFIFCEIFVSSFLTFYLTDYKKQN